MTYGWTLDEIITLAEKGGFQFGILNTQTRAAFKRTWEDWDAIARERETPNRLRARLSASTWIARPMPPIERLLGDFITTTTRAFLVGRTGLGKTMLGLAIAMAIGFGLGFLHWRSSRPARVLFIDGEMSTELMIARIRGEAKRIGRQDLIDNIMVFSLEDAEELAEQFPSLGMFEPLNTEAGHAFLKRLVALLKPDVIIFDNVQSLLAGVQKDEETWVPALPLVNWLTKQRIGQLWFDHAGLADRQYGSVVKSWRMDALGLMTPLPEADPRETAFLLSFDAPHGKARRRTPENWVEFAPHIIRLREGVWSSEPAEKRIAGRGHVPPSRAVFYDALVVAIGRHGGSGCDRVALSAWEAQCYRRGLIDRPDAKETAGAPASEPGTSARPSLRSSPPGGLASRTRR